MDGLALYESEQEKLSRIAINLSAQYDAIRNTVEGSGGALNLTPEFIKELHRLAMQDLYVCAGQFRDIRRIPRRSSVRIIGSKHKPPEDDFVQGQVEDLCDRVNSTVKHNPIGAAAFLLWKLSWIHPFHGGNGRTARAAAYLTLCIGFNQFLPGRPTVIEHFDANRRRYIEALRDADSAWEECGVPDVKQLERLLDDLLRLQLAPPIRQPVVARQEEIHPSMLEPGRVIQPPVYPPPPPGHAPAQTINARDGGTDPSMLEQGRAIEGVVHHPPQLPPADE